MPAPKLAKLELQIMEVLWTYGPSPVREVLEHFPEESRPAYTTIQTMIYRLEAKKVVRRVKKIGSAHIFEAAVSRDSAQRRLVDELLVLFGGCAQPVMAHMIEARLLTLDDVRRAERRLQELEEDDKKGKGR